MINVKDLFDVHYGLNLELNALTRDDQGINFVSRTEKNNGVTARVRELPDIDPIPGGTISVACGGASVVESCLQLYPYYSGRDVVYLAPKHKLPDEVKLYYCVCLKANRFKYSFGRQANATLKDLPIPSEKDIPSWVTDFSIKKYAKSLLSQIKLDVNPQLVSKTQGSPSHLVPLETLFTLVNGVASSKVKRYRQRPDNTYIPFIRPSYRQATSVDAFVSEAAVDPKHVFPKGTLYVSTDGQGSHTYAYVSAFAFVPNSNVCVLLPTRTMSLQEKLYYADCITKNRFKFSYGRKPKGDRLLSLMLPEYPPSSIVEFDPVQLITKFSNIAEKL